MSQKKFNRIGSFLLINLWLIPSSIYIYIKPKLLKLPQFSTSAFIYFFIFDLKINLISAPPNTHYNLFKTKKRKLLSSSHTLTSPSPKPKTHLFLPSKSKPKIPFLTILSPTLGTNSSNHGTTPSCRLTL